ncbi:MBL fold metallo-hydrolase [Paradesertivirga mongoliensis]|uniref:MBL fold metallo-hydrolase n=1 Tax=Paradesertivirga mongoliensis TaxID=2100740 RepID=A0ABW4ZMT2_9SPHI|nr:MBL fold metallo-hydrolase [Pedobacter mongoliensis]
MNLYSIETGYFKLDGGAMFGVVPKSIWSKTNPADENNLCSLAMRSLLIEDGNRLVLVDTGIGNKQSEKFLSYYYLHGDDSLEKSLSKHGFSKDDITDVFLTHLHLDHSGGAVERVDQKLVPAFKNATYWSNTQHWDWAIYPNDREKASFLKENILPLEESGQLKFIDRDNNELIGSIKTNFAYGHTDAMMLPQVVYKGRTILFAADLIPTAGHIPIPYVAGYDVYPLMAMDEKKVFLKEALQNDYILFMEHDAVNECCTLVETEKGIRLGETFKLNEI